MITEVWIESVEDSSVTIKFTDDPKSPNKVDIAYIPRIGEKVGWVETGMGGNTYNLDTVVDIRTYYFQREVEHDVDLVWVQEIHVMCSKRF